MTRNFQDIRFALTPIVAALTFAVASPTWAVGSNPTTPAPTTTQSRRSVMWVILAQSQLTFLEQTRPNNNSLMLFSRHHRPGTRIST